MLQRAFLRLGSERPRLFFVHAAGVSASSPRSFRGISRLAPHPTIILVSSRNLYSGTSRLYGAGPLRILPDAS